MKGILEQTATTTGIALAVAVGTTALVFPGAAPWAAAAASVLLVGLVARRESSQARALAAVQRRLAGEAPETVESALERFAGVLDRAVAEGETRWAGLMEDSAAALFVHDGGRFIEANRAACELFGCSREELFRTPPGQILPREAADVSMPGGRPVRVEQIRRQNGGEVSVEMIVTVGRVDGGARAVVIARDIGARLLEERDRELKREQLQLVADHLPSLVALVDRNERYQFVNRAFARWFERFDRDLVGCAVGEVFDEASYRYVRPYVERTLAGTTAVFQHVIHDHAGNARHFLATYVPHRRDGAVVGFVALEHDITEVESATRRLRESEARYRHLVESSPYCIHEMDPDGVLRSVNSAGLRMMGKRDERELVGVNMMMCAARDDMEAVRGHIQAAARGLPAELEYRTPDGRTFASSLTPVHDSGNRPRRLMGIVRDISERKREEVLRQEAEEEVRRHLASLKALSARLESVREEERKRIAREIHDELGQLLTGLKMEIHGVENSVMRLPEGELRAAMEDRVIEAGSLADRIIRSVREIAMRIRPSVLDELGLIPALAHECARFEERAGIRCDFSADEGFPRLEDELATTFFRLAQEFLTNIARHAGANRAEVRLGREDGQLVLRVTDDGVGIPKNAETVSGHLGLIGARERVNSHDGTLTLDGLDGSGSVVTVRLPMPGEAHPSNENPDS